MDLALLEEKNLINLWKQKQADQRKSRKKSGLAGKNSKREKTSLDLGSIFAALTAGLAMVILIVACLYGIYSGYRFMTHSPRFNINEMNLVGHQRLSTEDLTSWIGPTIGKNIFQLDLNEISKKLAKHPWVQSASARRVLPQGIHVELKERTPFVRIQLDQVYVMDNYGILLGPGGGDFNKLPLITGIKVKHPELGNNVADEEIIRGLKAMHYLNLLPMFGKNPIDKVHINNRSRITFVTHNQNIKVHMRPGMARESFKNLMLALDTIGKNEQDFSYIDLSFKNKVVIKHRKAVKRDFKKNTKT